MFEDILPSKFFIFHTCALYCLLFDDDINTLQEHIMDRFIGWCIDNSVACI